MVVMVRVAELGLQQTMIVGRHKVNGVMGDRQ